MHSSEIHKHICRLGLQQPLLQGNQVSQDWCLGQLNMTQTQNQACKGKTMYLRLQVTDHKASNDLLRGEVGERHLAGQHFPENHAQAPHISLLTHTLRVRHKLWSHVGQSAPAQGHKISRCVHWNSAQSIRHIPLACSEHVSRGPKNWGFLNLAKTNIVNMEVDGNDGCSLARCMQLQSKSRYLRLKAM